MSAAALNFIIGQGETWTRLLTWLNPDGVTPINLTGYSARMQIRLTVDSTAVLLELNTTPVAGQGTITLGGVLGTITLSASAALTAALTFAGASTGSVQEGTDVGTGLLAVYDLDLTSGGGVVTTLARGSVVLVKEITR